MDLRYNDRMRFHLISTAIAAALLFGCTPEPVQHRNLAVVVAKYLNLPNLTCEELGTGWGFTPDTAICQSADLQGAVRVPSTVIWCAAGAVGEPTCRTVADFKAGAKK